MEYFEYRNVVIEAPYSPEAEAYRKLELNIAMMSIDKKTQVIQCTSPTPEDGKTTTAINLAAVYAEKKKKVIILDFDMRRPKIHRAFHAVNDKGFYDYITDDVDVHELIIHDESGIDLLLTGRHFSFPHIVLESHKTKELVEKLRQEYDFIIVDTPPVLSVTDSIIISNYVDGVVYVIAYNKTKKEDAKAALAQLQKNNARVLGTVFANVDVRKSKTYYSYHSEKQ